MTDRLLLDSFIVRIYRSDEDDARKVTGLVEAVDGSGEIDPFSGMDELSEIIINRTKGNSKRHKNGHNSRKNNANAIKLQEIPIN